MQDLKFEDLPKAIALLLDKVENLESELINIKENYQPIKPTQLMTRKETAQFFKVSLVTITNWVKYGVLTSHTIGNRVYFKRSEIISAMYASKKSV